MRKKPKIVSKIGSEFVCDVCKKVFLVTEPQMWVYKKAVCVNGRVQMIYWCSWKCTREYEKKHQESLKKRGRKIKNAYTI